MVMVCRAWTCRLVYSRLLTYGRKADLHGRLEGALLIDMWDFPDVPELKGLRIDRPS